MLIEQAPLIVSFFALIIALISLYKALKMPDYIASEADNILNTLDQTLLETVKPIQETISKSYSHMGTLGANAKQIKTLDAKIATDIIDMQDPLAKAALDMFPNVRDYVSKNPHLLMELLPRLQQLQQIEGFKLGDLINPNQQALPKKAHPFRLEE